MSENKAGFSPFNNQGAEPKVEAYKWGFNFKSVKGANTDITYGWKASGVFGLSTSVYVAPLGIQSTLASPFALTTMITNSETTYKVAKQWSNMSMMFTMSDITDLSKRWGRDTLMRLPAYMTMEFGAKCDFIFGNKYDYCTGSVNKSVNGETVNCYSDKVEWYYANLYKYIEGTELKMEVKKKNLEVKPSFINPDLTQVEVLNDKSHYAQNYAAFNACQKVTASKDIKHEAGGNLIQTAKGPYTLGASSVDITSGSADITATAMKALNLTSGNNIFLGSGGGTITLQCGPKKAVVISTGQTQINNQLSLGMPGVGAVPNVMSAMSAYKQEIAQLQADLKTAENDLRFLVFKK